MAFSPTNFFELTMPSSHIIKLFVLQYLFILLCLPRLGLGAYVRVEQTVIQTVIIKRNFVLNDPDTISSMGNDFKMGFFSPDNTTKNRYFGVFYNVSESTVIWVANRDNPIPDSSGSVKISLDGNIVLTKGKGEIVWSTNVTSSLVNPSVQLLSTGNLVLRNMSSGRTVWESFGHPSNNFLPTLRIIDNINTGNRVVVSSWKTPTDPEVGNFTAGLQALSIPQIYTWNGNRPHWRSGPWNGQILIGVQDTYSVYVDGFTVVNDSSGTFYFTVPEGKFLMRITLNSTGSLVQTLWNRQTQNWDITWLAPQQECDVYGTCGPFGSCNALTSPICSCLRGFEPKNSEEWGRGNWSGGCVRSKPLLCDRNNNTSGGGKEDEFFRLPYMKVPDFAEQGPSMTVEECRSLCSRNCSCIAYARDKNLGCMFWSQELIDIQQFSNVGEDLYIRLASSELDGHKYEKLIITIPIVVGLVAILLCIFIYCWLMARRKGDKGKLDAKLYESGQTYPSDSSGIVIKDDMDKVNLEVFPLFTLETVANATDQFHDDNMLGKGGFGPVYKGKLADGHEIAVKRLSAASRQGMEEFMNEVNVISELQHRNLVKLLGCCVEKEEKILVYEYMPNKSLDVFLFDTSHPSQKILDLKKRFSIIEGIGRGLLYLHRDSILKIIHRDLKPSNVLLDEDYNPKISDFGLARIFGDNQDQANTRRVLGTRGYKAPEYAMEGRFSEKSDVYSFGVLMLEIMSGKKNNFYCHEWSLSLLGWAWKLWNEDNGSTFIDQTIYKAEFQGEMVRCIHIALLCVQDFPNNRPTISTVLAMLSREIVDLPVPKQPTFADTSSGMGDSVNDVTLTILDGR
ncbi:G-type lectin S-receptor-like serine/threonine-protein kinase At1g11300 isoform X1 [Olea europaea var. sylvestris]|uniref:G-type lectin S-receptor-like serine/threonine-protein kinase At1g11300 isoform X1 n=1 Tax=Olea europaea var. sylvestris TaxID=158386 RepID=UPI000C1D5802|nr:G-type lectin S-receptor-like serine/threonine-protein kinase At1g11300 isoform X1 [Olea europaea var. sylvestris]